MVWGNWLNFLIGLWFVAAPFVLGLQHMQTVMATSIVGGLILVILGAWAATNEEARRKVWIQYVNGLVGVWFVIAPWVLGFADIAAAMWTSLIGGLVVVAICAWLAFSELPRETATHR
ncbi:MAG: SPW repeat protein [Armatimonadota bacterium]|nr:SPW repeat protein [Armatimonadota bacterium]MDR5696425.1 SPW repeat protein [Armatimonadota bacterium]